MIRIEEKNLDQLQRISKIIGVISLIAFFVLLFFGSYQLMHLNGQISSASSELAQKQDMINAQEQQIKENEVKLEAQRKKITVTGDALKDVLKISSKETVNKVFNTNPGVAQSIPRIYVHIGNESQRKEAEKIAEALQLGGYIVPKIENVGDIAPPINQLRYCKDKGQQADVDNIKSILTGSGTAVDVRAPMTMASCNNVSSVRSYEFWLGFEGKKPKTLDPEPVDIKKQTYRPQ
jgi:hypothetical protein